jgi:zinc protease
VLNSDLSRSKYGASLCFFLIANLLFALNFATPTVLAETGSEEPFSAPKPKEWELSNGLGVRFLRDSELPIVFGTLYIRGGTIWQSADKLGSVAAMGSQLREGGAGELSPDQLNIKLDKLAAGVSSSFSQEWGTVSFSCLSRDLEEVFGLFSNVILRPKFDPKKLSLWKGNLISRIKRRKENPQEVAQIAFQQILYGDSPFGRVSTEKDIAKLTRQDVVAQYQKMVKPKGAILTLGGNLTEEQARKLVEERFGKWSGSADLGEVEDIKVEAAAGIYFIDMPVSQSSIFMGHLGVPRRTPDYASIDVFNEIFGSSGFGLARLFVRIRTELGLAYQVYGAISPGLKRGQNVIVVQTKAESTDEAMVESINVLRDIQENGVREEELREVKRSIENSYIFNFASTDRILGRHASIELLGWPDNFDQTYLPAIRLIGNHEVTDTSRSRWNLKDFVFVVVGNEDAYAQIERRLKEDPQALQGLQLKRLKFDQKLEWP